MLVFASGGVVGLSVVPVMAGGGGEDIAPGPLDLKPELTLPSGVHDPSGDVEELVAQLIGFGGVVGATQGELVGEGEQVAGDRHELAPQPVAVEGFEWRRGQPGVLRRADEGLDPDCARWRASNTRGRPPNLTRDRVGSTGTERPSASRPWTSTSTPCTRRRAHPLHRHITHPDPVKIRG